MSNGGTTFGNRFGDGASLWVARAARALVSASRRNAFFAFPIKRSGTSAVKKWRRGTFAALMLWLAASAGAEPIKIEFLPPPMEGTLSLGVYDAAGKLVRILHREAEASELTAGDDGLVTQWDGKDDNGAPCPPGIYRARGVMVGDLDVEGVDFIGNDWVSDDASPHLRRITGLGMNGSGAPVIAATLSSQTIPAYYAITLNPTSSPDDDADVQLAPAPGLPEPAKPTPESNGLNWVIKGHLVQQFSSKGKCLRTLAAQPDEPPPVKLAASPTEEKIYVLFESAKLQRLRGYDFTGVKPGDDPKVLFENDILASDTYEQIASELKFPDEKPFVSSPTLTVELVPNPLFHNKPGTLQIKVGVDKAGCYLATADGLPLCHVSDTKSLRWAVMGQPEGSKEITVFDSDGAVVEEFRVSKVANMMPFDAGVIQWTAPAATPTPSPSPSPAASPTPAPTSTPSPSAAPAKTGNAPVNSPAL